MHNSNTQRSKTAAGGLGEGLHRSPQEVLQARSNSNKVSRGCVMLGWARRSNQFQCDSGWTTPWAVLLSLYHTSEYCNAKDLSSRRRLEPFAEPDFSASNVQRKIRQLKLDTSPGLDEIPVNHAEGMCGWAILAAVPTLPPIIPVGRRTWALETRGYLTDI